MKKVLECIPNFSEGQNEVTLARIANAIAAVPYVFLLHQDVSAAANRTVFTFAGEPEAVVEAAYRAIKIASEQIDMRQQHGVHPRIGATDVCPLVPLYGMDMEEADVFAQRLAKRVGGMLMIPVFMYEYSQPKVYRSALPDIRKGQYEGLKQKMLLPEWKPDYGPDLMNEACGATVVGARKVLVAFNISISSKDISVARWIATQMRASTASAHSLPALRAIAWYMADYEQVQVSFNLLDYKQSSLLKVWNTCQALAASKDTQLIGSEVIGLIPEACLLEVGRNALSSSVSKPTEKQTIVAAAIQYLGLDQLKHFDPEEKILEWVWAKQTNNL